MTSCENSGNCDKNFWIQWIIKYNMTITVSILLPINIILDVNDQRYTPTKIKDIGLKYFANNLSNTTRKKMIKSPLISIQWKQHYPWINNFEVVYIQTWKTPLHKQEAVAYNIRNKQLLHKTYVLWYQCNKDQSR